LLYIPWNLFIWFALGDLWFVSTLPKPIFTIASWLIMICFYLSFGIFKLFVGIKWDYTFILKPEILRLFFEWLLFSLFSRWEFVLVSDLYRVCAKVPKTECRILFVYSRCGETCVLMCGCSKFERLLLPYEISLEISSGKSKIQTLFGMKETQEKPNVASCQNK